MCRVCTEVTLWWLQGFHTPLSYILTQLPLADTVDDFWRMVVEERSHSIVLLDAVDSDHVR